MSTKKKIGDAVAEDAKAPEASKPKASKPKAAEPADVGATKASSSGRKILQRVIELPDGTRRVYSPQTHGENWDTLATQYAEHNDGKEV